MLGDEEITPKIIDRMTSFLRMAKEEGIITDESLNAKLGFEEIISTQRVSYSDSFYEQQIKQLSSMIQVLNSEKNKLKNENQSLKTGLSIMRVDKEKQLRLENIKNGIIIFLKDLCEYSIEFNREMEWKFVINEIEEDKYFDIIDILMEQNLSFIRSL